MRRVSGNSRAEHVLPLGPVALAEVNALAKQALERAEKARVEGKPAPEAGRELLFSKRGRVGLAPSDLSHRVAEIAKAMAGSPFKARDLRRTCETMLAALGISRDVRAQVLSHGLGGVQQAHYDRHSYANEKRAALLAWERKLAAIKAGEPEPSNVTPMRAEVA